jgi:alkylation response protein AidB-like acyl-CoA dehydrogenase
MSSEKRQKAIIEEACLFAELEIQPYATEFDQQGALPRELIEKMAAKGYLAASFPEEFGGLELDPVYYGLLTEVIGKACCSTRALLTVQTSLVGETLLRWGNKHQKEKWLPLIARGEKIAAFALTEPNIGSDAKNVSCQYQKNGDNFIINGRKKWITYADIADFYLVIAVNEDKVSAFIIERNSNGVSTKPIHGLLGARAAHIAEIEFKDVNISKDSLLGPEGGGFTYVVNTALDHGRYSIAWAGVAIAQAAVEAMVSYARQREQFGKKIFHFQLIQGMIADAVTKTHAARALCLKAAEYRKMQNPEAIIETTIAKYFTSKIALEVASDAVQVHGGMGCCNKYPVERLFREAKILEIIEGTSQIQQMIISKYGLKKYHCSRT